MTDYLIPFPLEKDDYVVNSQALTVFAASTVQALAQTGRSSAVIFEGEPPELPYETDTWDLMEVENEYSLPIEIQRRINIVRNNNIPIKQILIAHEHPSTQLRLEEAARSEERTRGRGIDLFQILVGLALITVGLALLPEVATVITAVIVAMAKIVGAVLVGIVALLAMQGGLDPAVVCVLDDGYDSWLLVGVWYE